MDEARPGRVFHPWPRGNPAARSLLLATMIMVAYGTVAVASASEGQATANGGSSWSIAIHDVIYLGFGLLALYLGARVRTGFLIRRAPLAMVGGIGLLLAVKAIGVSANGGKRWLNLHVIYLQPSELFKFVTILYVAWAVLYHHGELGEWRRLALWMSPVLLGSGLILLEPDIGTSSVVVAIAVVVLAVAGLSRQLLTRIAVLGVLAFGGFMLVKPYSARRFLSFLHPSQDLQGSGYQLLQSKIGLGAGGLTGLGLGHSREKWGLLPNPHTDFIFTIIGEELGLIGTLAVIGLFVWFLFSATRIALNSQNAVQRLVVVGIVTWIVLEAVINIASVVGGWAVTGIPLPFFSYGGTALITELFGVGVLYNIGHDTSRLGNLDIEDHVAVVGRAPRTAPRAAPPVAPRHGPMARERVRGYD
ncbi:MAG: FtsW/RodA/SpoVE family cell cycle protein [Acidimicrobiales bacterium]